MTVEPTTKDKQITIEVPEDRVAEFYAFYGRFLAGPARHRRGHRGHGCHSRHAQRPGAEAQEPQPAAPETTSI